MSTQNHNARRDPTAGIRRELESDDHDDSLTDDLDHDASGTHSPNGAPVWHRISEVRNRQGVSLRTVARHWDIEISEARRQQNPAADLTLSQLYRWQEVLGVPVAELLVEDGEELSNPVLRRAQLVKVMKTAMTIREGARDVRVQRLITTLIDQLVEIMPELKEVGPWHGSGNRRSLDEYGRACDYRLSEDALHG
ncbi:MAG: hypothetical protein K8T25_04280 [Planctomycetia bacterium]|nr:hypothetical protein [Planctomycetia bacterium]